LASWRFCAAMVSPRRASSAARSFSFVLVADCSSASSRSERRVGNLFFRLGQLVGRVFLFALGAADVLLERTELLLDTDARRLGGGFLLAALGLARRRLRAANGEHAGQQTAQQLL